MNTPIPTYILNNLFGENDENPDVFFVEHNVANSNTTLNIPYRSNYFGIGLCFSGQATLKANLETYEIEPNTIISMSPQIVKQWLAMSDDYKTFSVFFTKDFFVSNPQVVHQLDSFSFFEMNAQHVSTFSDTQTDTLRKLLLEIKAKLSTNHPHKKEIIQHLIHILLYEISAFYSEQNFSTLYRQTRNQKLTVDFKNVVFENFRAERGVKFYADSLFLTTKHLSEIIKTETGKTAGEWIDDAVMLEAKILLQDKQLTISQVADNLSFGDQSMFGKFFKNLSGVSPLVYRKNIVAGGEI